MTAKAPAAHINNAIKDYMSGDSSEVAAARWHTSEKRLTDLLKSQGLLRSRAEVMAIKGRKISANSGNKIDLPAGEICARYTGGQSENALAKSFGVSRNVIARVLAEGGIVRYSLSEANSLRYVGMSRAQRKAVVKAAQDAIRGRPANPERLRKAAITREAAGFTRSRAEMNLADTLLARGVEFIPQKAIDKYSIDFAIGSLAVEIFGGFWHGSKPKHAERSRYILNAGWDMLFVWVHGRSPLNAAVADYIVAYADELRRNPTATRQYRVIRGDGKELARGSADDDNITVVPKGFEGGRGS